MKQPPKWKFAIMVWLAIYPTITLVSLLIGDYIDGKRINFEQFDRVLLLVNGKGNRLYPKYVYNVVRQYLNSVTTIDKKSPHVLRHSFATHFGMSFCVSLSRSPHTHAIFLLSLLTFSLSRTTHTHG